MVIVDSQKKTSLLVWYIYFVQCVLWVEMTIAFSLEMNDYIIILVCLLIILLWWPISSYRAVMQSPNWRWLKTILDSLKNKGARSAQVQNCLWSFLDSLTRNFWIMHAHAPDGKSRCLHIFSCYEKDEFCNTDRYPFVEWFVCQFFTRQFPLKHSWNGT